MNVGVVVEAEVTPSEPGVAVVVAVGGQTVRAHLRFVSERSTVRP